MIKLNFPKAILQVVGITLGLSALMFGTAEAQEAAPQDKPGAVKYDAVLTVDTLDNQSGGLRQGTWGQANLDLTAVWQGPKGWEAYGYVVVDQHGSFSQRYAGDVQGISNIDAPPGLRLLEAWTRHTTVDQKFITTFGVINLNGIFDTQPTGGAFLNSSDGIGPDYSQNGTSGFPFSGLGFVQEWHPLDTLRLRVGAFDGVPGDPNHPTVFTSLRLSPSEGLNLVGEAETDFTGGFIKIGHWAYTAKSPRIDGAGNGTRQGTYAQASYTITHEKDHPDQGLAAWLRAGIADGSLLRLSGYTGGGFVYTGLIMGRGQDVAGISIACAHYGSPYRQANPQTGPSETTVELTYQAQIKPGTTVQPDVQFVHHPSGDSSIKDAVVIGIRLKIDLAS